MGYAVMGGTDPGALVPLARQARPFDAVLIDAGWLPPGASASWIESLFSARNVPCSRCTATPDARAWRSINCCWKCALPVLALAACATIDLRSPTG